MQDGRPAPRFSALRALMPVLQVACAAPAAGRVVLVKHQLHGSGRGEYTRTVRVVLQTALPAGGFGQFAKRTWSYCMHSTRAGRREVSIILLFMLVNEHVVVEGLCIAFLLCCVVFSSCIAIAAYGCCKSISCTSNTVITT